jgi:hypothetical protein
LSTEAASANVTNPKPLYVVVVDVVVVPRKE